MPRKLRRVVIVFLANVVLSIVMLAVSRFLGALDPPFFYGTLLGVLLSTAQFALLANALEKSAKPETVSAGFYMIGQYAVRILILAAVVIFALSTHLIDAVPMVITLFFPQAVIIANGVCGGHWL